MLDEMKESYAALIQWFETTSDKLDAFFAIVGKITDAAGIFFQFLGWETTIFLVITLMILGLINMASPLSKAVNFLFAFALGVILLYFTNQTATVYYKYALVMLFPFLIGHFLRLLWKSIVWGWKKWRQPPVSPESLVTDLLAATHTFQTTQDLKKLQNDLEAIGENIRLQRSRQQEPDEPQSLPPVG